MIHLLGLSGAALIILSITARAVVRSGLIGLAGSATFVTYGLVLGAWPIVVTNIVTSSIHLFHLHRRRRVSMAGSHHQTFTRSFRRRAGGRRQASA